MAAILHGVRVLDLTTIVAGPYATMLLADLGAEIIKVEAPGGDAYRSAKPTIQRGVGAPFVGVNRGKRSVGIDLKTPGGQTVLARLASRCDVVVSNMRPAAATRLGVDAQALQAHNPQLIHCSSTGFGSDGPDAELPAYDDVIQGRAGLSSLLGFDRSAPVLAPTVMADKVTGLHVTQAVLAALYHRERTGEALVVEVPMLETVTSFVMAEHMGGAAMEPPIGPVGYNRLLTPNRRPFATTDGHVVILPYTSRHWAALLDWIEAADADPAGAWAAATWITDADERAGRVGELYGMLGDLLRTRSSEEWITVLRELDIPAGHVNSLAEVFNDPHLAALGFFERTETVYGTVVSPRHPVRYAGEAQPHPGPPPLPGQDTADLLAEIGFDEQAITGLLTDRAVWGS
ncbi:CaiB/BaiF CoA transferase family protein [Euzebya tangerina]|uniref:CaiB/BaiF CoA transferase family protein n=1 Tax=Euzebya tangerina TaxID=591198 RepID=UPI000E3236CF|nr:CoA transferase [Euzebya tangerina]